jgi:hypothetical protein
MSFTLENIEDATCPDCGRQTLGFDLRLRVAGLFIHGNFVATGGDNRVTPFVFCASCPFEKAGLIVGREIWVQL